MARKDDYRHEDLGIYGITKTQLRILWVTAIFFFVAELGAAGVLAIGLLAFYTAGWLDARKKKNR